MKGFKRLQEILESGESRRIEAIEAFLETFLKLSIKLFESFLKLSTKLFRAFHRKAF